VLQLKQKQINNQKLNPKKIEVNICEIKQKEKFENDV
jgi:hypothetical protein